MNLDWLKGLGADEKLIAERRREIIAGAEPAALQRGGPAIRSGRAGRWLGRLR